MKRRVTYLLVVLLLPSACARFNAASPFLYLFYSKNPVKGVQSGTVQMSAASTASVSITPVDPAAAFSICYFRTSSSAATQPCATDLTSAGTLAIATGAANANLYVTWYVVEFNSGVTVQRGTQAIGIGTAAATIPLSPAVDLSRSFPIVQTWTGDTNNNLDEERTVSGTLSSASALSLARNQSTVAVTSHWQVVQMTDASVQSGTATIAAGELSKDVPVAGMSTAKTFVIATVRADAASNGNDEEYFVRISVTGTSTVHFERYASANTVSIAYYVVSLTDQAFVLSGTTGSGVGSYTNTDFSFSSTLPQAIDTSKTVPFSSSMVSNTGAGGPSTDQDTGALAPTFPNTSTIQLQRGSAQPRDVSGSYFAVQFQGSSFQ